MNKYHMVLGSEGLIGKELCKYIKQAGHIVRGIDIKNGSQFDLRKIELNLDNVSHVYFLAWNVGGSKFLYQSQTQTEQLEWNTALLNNVMGQLKYFNGKTVFISSQLAQDSKLIYGVLKRLGELWSEDLGFSVIRLWNVYGFEKVDIKSHVVTDFIDQAINNNCIKMLTSGKEQRQFTYVKDAVQGIFDINNHMPTDQYNLTHGKWTQVLDIAKIISHITGCKIIQNNKKGYSCHYEPKEIYNQFNTTTLDNGIRDIINDYYKV